MAEDNIGGLSAEVSGDASRLFSVLQQSELRMREFVSKYGNVNLQIRAQIQIPSATAVLDARRNISRLFRDPAAGGLTVPLQMAMPSQTATNTFVKGLTGQIGTITVNVKGNWVGWEKAPPSSFTMSGSPGGGAEPVARSTMAPVARAAGVDPKAVAQAQANAEKRTIQYTTPTGGLARVHPQGGGGAVGGGEGYAVGGQPLGIGGFRPPRYGFTPGRDDLYENMRAQDDYVAAQRAAAQGLRPGQAGGFARAAGAQRDPATGRFLSGVMQPVARPTVAPTAKAAEIYQPPVSSDVSEQERELRALTGEFGPNAQTAAENRLPSTAGFGRRRRPPSEKPSQPTRKIGPDERESIIGATPELEEGVQARIAAQTRLIAARQATTVRAPGTFLAGLISTRLGGSEARETQQQAAAALTEQRQLQERLTLAKDKEFQMERAYAASTNPAQKKAIRAELNTQREVVEHLGNQYQVATKNATELSIAAQKAAGGGLRNLAAGFIGGIAGGLAFGVGMQAVTAIVGGMAEALKPAIARATNFGEVAGQVSDTLASITQQRAGLADQAIAQVFAGAGFKGAAAEQVRPQLLAQAQTSAGLAAFQQQRDLLQANFNFQNAQGTPGITSSIGGGIFGIGAQKGLVEQLRQDLEAGFTTSNITGRVPSGFTPEALAANNQKTVDLLNQELSSLGITIKDQTEAGVSKTAALRQQSEISRLPSQGTLTGTQASDLANALADRGLVLTAAGTGKVLTAEELVTGVKEAFKNLPKPSVQDLLTEQQPMIDAQKALFREQALTQRRMFIPAQFALAQAANPLTAFGTGVTQRTPTTVGGQRIPIPAQFGGAFGGAGFDASAKQFGGAFDALAPMISDVDKQLVKMQADGQSALEALVPRSQLAEFKALEKQISSVGSTISGLKIGVQQEQTNLQVAQYNEQLRIAHRTETDLLQITGRIGSTSGDNLGILEKQNIALGRQSQELTLQSQQLSIQQQQRQLNFQVALAGFVAPGATPAERAARIEEAKIEAEFAQKQLDIQKQQAGIAGEALPIQFKIQDTGFSRQLTDVQAQIGLLNQGIKVAVDTAAAQQAIEHLSALQDQLVQRAGTYVQEGMQGINAMQQGAAQIMAKTAEGFSYILQQTAKAWGVFMTQASVAISSVYNTGTGAGSGANAGTSSSGFRERAAQTGFLGVIGSPTKMTIGEAGAETVAILRNPREMAMGGGAGQQIILNISVSGNVVRSDDDLKQLVSRITREVEVSISRKISLLGGRGAAVS
jgi:hypothetical protein